KETKLKYREEDKILRNQIAEELEKSGWKSDTAQKLAAWDPYDQNASSPFFDPEWMFDIKDGFDIVMGNPPYIQLQENGGHLAKIYAGKGFETFERTGDIYTLFYEKGVSLLKDNGILCFITSNKWMRAGYGEKTRKFFSTKTNPIILIDFSGQKIFESATVDTNVLLLSKQKNRQQTKACIVKEKVLNNLSDYFRQNSNKTSFQTSESWVILSSIERQIKDKIERIGTPLRDWDINIYRGILTGFNEAFIIDGKKKDELIAQDPKSAEIIRPILRGRDIKRYGYDFADKWLISTFPSKSYNIDDFPAVKNYLLGFKPKLKQTGEKLTNEEIQQVIKHAEKNGIQLNEKDLKTSRKKTTNKWFETQDSIGYWEEFFKPKIIFQEMVQEPSFVYDKEGKFLCLDTARIITGDNIEYLLHILNSKLFFFAIKRFYGGGGLGDTGVRMKHTFFEQFPIPPLNKIIDYVRSNNTYNYQEI